MSLPLRIGMLGMGNAGLAFVPAIARHPEFELAAFVEPHENARLAAQAKYGVPGHATLAQLLAEGPRLDAVCIASPTEYHTAQALQAMEAGLHVLVEKPMAIALDDARSMVRAARERGVVLLVGHSHSYDLPIRKMREVIASGRLGGVRMAHNWCFTDWIYRPRRPDELDARQGGGVTLRQGSHQFDILRLLCGGEVRRVRARAFDLDRGGAPSARTALTSISRTARLRPPCTTATVVSRPPRSSAGCRNGASPPPSRAGACSAAAPAARATPPPNSRPSRRAPAR